VAAAIQPRARAAAGVFPLRIGSCIHISLKRLAREEHAASPEKVQSKVQESYGSGDEKSEKGSNFIVYRAKETMARKGWATLNSHGRIPLP
jgi:hypothetical protein